jgi:hypothetical protein
MVHCAQFFRRWLYPLSIVSMVTIIRSNGARKAGMRQDHESFRGTVTRRQKVAQLC